MRYLLTSLLCVFTLSITAQLPNGSVAPDFTATDIDGNEWNLYDLLDEGNTVILNFGATWTGPVWNYAQTGILQDLYSTFGPDGTGDLYIFFLESDDSTTAADLNGTGPATTGDWVSITNFPIIDNASNIFDSYSNTYYPSIYTVCPDGTMNTDTGEMEYTLVESGQDSFEGHVQAAFMTCANSITGAAPLMSYNGETSSCGGGQWMASTSVNNLGSDDVTAMIFTAELNGVAQDDITWGGVISNGGSGSVDLGSYNETGTFDYSLISVNGSSWNAEETVNITGSTPTTSDIQVRITTDNWPEETGWTLESASGMYIYGVETGSLANPNTEYTWDVALDLYECYIFTMTDTFGDGFNASQWGDYVDGSAQIIDLNLANVILSVEGYMQFAEIIFGINTLLDGCTDDTACNFNTDATENDGSCWYAILGYDCDGNCLVDTDGDGVCDEFEVNGCTEYYACNFNTDATENDGSCSFVGDPCDDLNPLTLGDYVDEDCFCGGIEITNTRELEALTVLIYPNPSSNNLTIDLGDLTGVNTSIKLYDSSSKLVFEKLSSATLLIDVSVFAKGLYTLELSTSDKVLRSQVVVE